MSIRELLAFFPSRIMADETQEAGGVHFPFPFTPYAIQKDFMAALYQVLEAGKIGIFESPTGTVSMTSGGPRRSGETLMTSQRPPACSSACTESHGVKLRKVVLSIYHSE